MIEIPSGMSKEDVAAFLARRNHAGGIAHLLNMAGARIETAMHVKDLPERDRQFLSERDEEIYELVRRIQEWEKEEPNAEGHPDGEDAGAPPDGAA